MGKRCIYNKNGDKFIIDDKDEIPEGFGVDPELLGKEQKLEIIKPVSKKKTAKKSK